MFDLSLSLDMLACPKCHERLEISGSALNCRSSSCGAKYAIQDGIPNFLPKEAAERFKKAQDAESTHHEDAWKRLDVGYLPGVKSLPDYQEWLECFYLVGFYAFGFPKSYWRKKVVLEIGAGPFGMLACVPNARGVAVDPLMPSFACYMKPIWTDSTIRIAALGEALPSPSETFDAAVAINCLDHTLHPELILKEVRRTLKPGADFLIMNNVKSTAGTALTRLGEICGISKLTEVYHPHAFTARSLAEMSRHSGFEVVRDYSAKFTETEEVRARYSWKASVRRWIEDERALWLHLKAV